MSAPFRGIHIARLPVVAAAVVTIAIILLLVATSTPSVSPGSPGGAGGGLSVSARPSIPSLPAVVLDAPGQVAIPGKLPGLPWPATGEAAVGVQGIGLIASSPRHPSVPIASVTKIMTAYVILTDHPLAGSEGGPTVRISRADALAYQHDAQYGDSNLGVVPGEVLDERQLLEGLLIPSADNVADLLARWDAGSIPAFVARMNAVAKALGMASTRYADASGLDPKSVSTAADQVRLASVVMHNPVLASIVDNATVRLPVSGKVWNYNPLVGIDGVVGVKSGFTQAAAACLVIAAWRTVGGRKVLVVAASLHQPYGLYGAAEADRRLLDAVTPLLGLHRVVTSGDHMASVEVPWAAHGAARAVTGAEVVGWPGLRVTIDLGQAAPALHWVPARTAAPGPRGAAGTSWVLPSATRVGSVVIAVQGEIQLTVPITLAKALNGPPPGWPGPGH